MGVDRDYSHFSKLTVTSRPIQQTCDFDLTENLNECENKSEYIEKNLNLTTKIALS